MVMRSTFYLLAVDAKEWTKDFGPSPACVIDFLKDLGQVNNLSFPPLKWKQFRLSHGAEVWDNKALLSLRIGLLI